MIPESIFNISLSLTLELFHHYESGNFFHEFPLAMT
jgi:hypothetical protein